jgi:hypothetical protein
MLGCGESCSCSICSGRVVSRTLAKIPRPRATPSIARISHSRYRLSHERNCERIHALLASVEPSSHRHADGDKRCDVSERALPDVFGLIEQHHCIFVAFDPERFIFSPRHVGLVLRLAKRRIE